MRLLSLVLAGVTIGCAPRTVALPDLWDPSARGGQTIATTGVLALSSPDRCEEAELVDGATRVRVHVESSGSVCKQIQAANGRRVRVEGTVTVVIGDVDVHLRPDAGGCEPFLVVLATRVDVVP